MDKLIEKPINVYQSGNTYQRNYPIHICCFLILVLTVILRAYALNSHTVPDESIEVNRAINFLAGEFKWSRITKGGIYLLLVPVYYVSNLFSQNDHFYLLAGRIIQVIIGSFLICFVYQSLKLLYGSRWALIFIIPAILNAQLIYNSHHVNVQNLMFLGVIIHVFLFTIYLEQKKNQFLGFSLIPLAISVASQISAIIVIIPFIVFSLRNYFSADMVTKKSQKRIIIKYGIISIFVYILMTPGILFYFGNTAKAISNYLGLSKDMEVVAGTTFSYATIKNINLWVEYGHYIVNFYGKVNITLIIISSSLIFIKKKWGLLYPLSILVLFYLIFANASHTTYGGRYIIPGLIMGFIILPFAVVEFYNWLTRHKRKASQFAAISIIILISVNFARNAANSIEYLRQFSLPDTRDIASTWMAKNVLKRNKILTENTCNFPKVPNPVQSIYVPHWNAYPYLNTIDAEYIMINKNILQYLSSKGSKTSYHRFYEELESSQKWKLVFSITPEKDIYTGPELEIYSRIQSMTRPARQWN